MENSLPVRLNKAISDTGFCSRREADKLIEQGRVTINDLPGVLGSKVHENDVVKVDGKPIQKEIELVYLAFNKPKGITCTTEQHVKGNIIDYINHPARIFPIGRLDKDSEGLIFLTNDGNIVNKILRAGNHHDKEYIVTVNKKITDDFILKMGSGVPILDTVTAPCKVKQIDSHTFKIILTQGLNRQIRRMCEYFNYEVTRLKRIRIMFIGLEGLAVGKWRDLTPEELKEIQRRVAGSVKTEEASVRKG
jgi:23S rRNA pseudouridine2604 synthase